MIGNIQFVKASRNQNEQAFQITHAICNCFPPRKPPPTTLSCFPPPKACNCLPVPRCCCWATIAEDGWVDTPSSSEEEEEAEEGEGERKCFLVRTMVCFVLFCLDAVCVIGVAAV